jgi:two-component system sensor histidine kinase DegS
MISFIKIHFKNIYRERVDNFLAPRFLVVILVLGIVTFIYYELQFSGPVVFDLVPWSRTLVIWEYCNNLIGSLFYIPILFSLLILSRRELLIIWAISMALILPRILYYYFFNAHDMVRIISNIFYLSIPILIFAYIDLEIQWRTHQKQIFEEKEKERQNYLMQIIKAQEDERKRLAREIHDDSIQRLSVIAGNTRRIIREEHIEDFPRLKVKIEDIQNMIIDVSHDLRKITLDLRPTVLDDLGLLPALRWLIDGFEKESNIKVQMEVTGEKENVSNTVSIQIFRVVQQALNNIKQHSEANQVNVTVNFINQMIKVIIKDNGRGFFLPKTNSEFALRSKLGIIGMQQRTQLIDGSFSCQSEIGKGTVVSIESKIYCP